MGTYHKTERSNNLTNTVIGVALVIFALTLAWFVFKILLGLAPLIGVFVAIAGGIWYLQAEDEHYKFRALQTLFAGVMIAIVFGAIF